MRLPWNWKPPALRHTETRQQPAHHADSGGLRNKPGLDTLASPIPLLSHLPGETGKDTPGFDESEVL